MRGLMMDVPLLIKQLLWRGERVFGDKEVVTRREGAYHRYDYARVALRSKKLSAALASIGVGRGERVGTLAWNTHQHYEAYFGVPCMGAVLHTINLRLFPEQIAHVINHAGDKVIMFDADQRELVEQVAPSLTSVEHYIALGSEPPAPSSSMPSLLSYEELLAAADGDVTWPDLDENAAAVMCYTSATTGDPKGVVYSHRSVVLHAMNLAIYGSIGVREDSTFLAISPMFHANSWGIPYAAAMQGAKLVLPGLHPQPADYLEAIERERVTHAVGAVTIGVMMRDILEQGSRFDVSSLRTLWLGGQAPPRGLMEWWRNVHDVDVPQGWGMTEASPLATFTEIKSKFAGRSDDEIYAVKAKQGLPLPLSEIKLVDDSGKALPWDGETVGEYLLRSPTLASEYYNDARSAQSFVDGWFRTGDVGVIDPDGYVQLTDRAKDLIKSGGEWISSVELENALMAHPAVLEATVVAIPDERWLERPIACVVARGAVTAEDLSTYLAERFAKWWVPTEYVFLSEIPKTGVGKFDKKVLRSRFADPTQRAALSGVPAEHEAAP